MAHVRIVAVGALVALVAGVGFYAVRGDPTHVSTFEPPAIAPAPADALATPRSATDLRPLPGIRSVHPDRPVVILVHGLGRRPASMAPLGRGLVEAGFRVVNLGYPSWTTPADTLVALLADSVASCCSDAGETVNFVTHSLGGILVRKYIEDYSPKHTGRVVMLAPPNGGSEIIDFVQTVPGLRALLGPTGSELGTDSLSLPNTLGPASFRLGVITGDRSLNPVYSWLIPGPDDGKVSVERARMEGVDQFLVVPFSHSFIMNREPVIAEVSTFLTQGSFSDEALASWGYNPPAAQDTLGIDPDTLNGPDTLGIGPDTLVPTVSTDAHAQSLLTR